MAEAMFEAAAERAANQKNRAALYDLNKQWLKAARKRSGGAAAAAVRRARHCRSSERGGDGGGGEQRRGRELDLSPRRSAMLAEPLAVQFSFRWSTRKGEGMRLSLLLEASTGSL